MLDQLISLIKIDYHFYSCGRPVLSVYGVQKAWWISNLYFLWQRYGTTSFHGQ